MKKERRDQFRIIVRQLEDHMQHRIRADNRRGLRKDGTVVDRETIVDKATPYMEQRITPFMLYMEQDAERLKDLENRAEAEIKSMLKTEKIYTEFLSKVKGCGPRTAAWILSEIDIEKATTPSKIIQYAGMNPGMVRGKKVVKITKANRDNEFIRRYQNLAGEECGIIEADEFVRGDKLTTGYVSPFNAKFRAKMLGVLAPSFIKAKSDYAKFYYDYKNRLEQSEQITLENGKEIMWKDCTKLHRHKASLRYMMRMFFIDLYKVWREMEGLPARPPYAEEYLGKVHHTA